MSRPRPRCPDRAWLLALLICAVAGASSPAPAAADEMYRWVDAEGRVHFSSTPPPGAQRFEPGRKLNRLSAPAAPEQADEAQSTRSAPDPSRMGPDRVPNAAPSHRRGGHTRRWWRDSARRHAARITSLENQIDRAEQRIADSATWRNQMSASRYESKMQRLIQKLERDLERAEEAQDAFEDEARRAEVPPRWLR